MKYFLIFLLVFYVQFVLAQDPLRFINEIEQLENIDHQLHPNKETIVFAGSSSFRMWRDIADYFPDYNIVNSGFGGSHMSDLLYFADQLIIKFKPDKVFIYEGDNDLESKKSPEEIITTTNNLINMIKMKLPGAEIFLLSAKPSPARWYLKKSYEMLNDKFIQLSLTHKNVHYVNVWDIMINSSGSPIKNIFIEDSLHMNKSGYELWANEIYKYID
jgi:lysophospholipase L1-like esterase